MSWGTLGQEPGFDVGLDQGFHGNEFKYKTEDGGQATDLQQRQQLLQQGGMKCPNPKCSFVIKPQVVAQIKASSGYFTCPSCYQSYDLMDELPWHGPQDANLFGENFQAGGGTRIGIPMQDQAQIGENLVAKLHDLPGYGPIVWMHPGGSISQSPLDGATKDWGLEIKTLSYDSLHHRFIPGRQNERQDKNNQAASMGLKGVLGILVILDYRRDVADIYGKEMPLEPWKSGNNWNSGVSTFRKNTAQKLLTEVPFENPYKDPSNPTPTSYNMGDYYKAPSPHEAEPTEDMPF
jgi:hypothetical protein